MDMDIMMEDTDTAMVTQVRHGAPVNIGDSNGRL